MTLTVALFWSFRSPYSYIVLPRIVELSRVYDVAVDLRIVHPAAIRNPGYFARMDPIARSYFMLDSARAAAFHDLPFRRPIPDPILQDHQTLAIATQHPLAVRLGRLGIAATQQGQGLDFCSQVAQLLWDGRVMGWDQGPHLANAASRAGVDLLELEALVAHDPDYYERQLAENNDALRSAGHWGVPAMVFDGELFFGQDRFDVLVWRLNQRGLSKRQPP